MSLVITPSRSSSASSWQIKAMIDDLPVPTGPATPRRSDLVTAGSELVMEVEGKGAVSGAGSGTEQPLLGDGVELGPRLDVDGTEGGNVLGRGEYCQSLGQRFDLIGDLHGPDGGVGRIHRMQLEGCRADGLDVVVGNQASGGHGVQAGQMRRDANGDRTAHRQRAGQCVGPDSGPDPADQPGVTPTQLERGRAQGWTENSCSP